MSNGKSQCESNLKNVIELASEMLGVLKNGTEDPEDHPMEYFIECYEELNHSLSRAVVEAVKSQLLMKE